MPYQTTAEQIAFKKTRFSFLQLCNRYLGRSARVFSYLDQQSFTLPGGSNVTLGSTTEFTVPLPYGTLLDTIVVNPTFALPAGLTVDNAYVNLASVGQGAQGQTLTAGTFKVRFSNQTAGALDAAGVYTYFQAGR